MLTLDLMRGPFVRRWLSLALLLTLHGALWLGLTHPLARPLLIIHLGFFLIWQPLWRREARLSRARALAILAFSLLALFWLNNWLLAFWVAGLFALIGARAFTYYSRWMRIYHLLVMSYLLALLLLVLAPQLFNLPEFGEVTGNLMNYGLPLLLLLMALLPAEREPAQAAQAIDFIYVILLFMLVVVLVFGSLAFMTLKQADYLSALFATLAFVAAALFILGALWHPQSGFGGFQAGFSRYVLSIGTPLEQWLQQLDRDAQARQAPQDFLQSATLHLTELPGVVGLVWNSREGQGNLGISTPHRVELAEQDLSLTLFMRTAVAPSLLLHQRLLVRVLGYFYQAKRREQRLREITRQQVIYETGARLTHDLKNMLQSLFALTSIAQDQPARAQPILQQHLPQLAQRIESILGKLKTPEAGNDEVQLPLADWWRKLRERYGHCPLTWMLQGDSAANIPLEMFDCVADNLIGNAINKRLREPDIRITVRLDSDAQVFSVSDNGSTIPPQRAQSLLHTVVPSEDGLGVGLFQAARWAKQKGWHLQLAENRPREVRFELRPAV